MCPGRGWKMKCSFIVKNWPLFFFSPALFPANSLSKKLKNFKRLIFILGPPHSNLFCFPQVFQEDGGLLDENRVFKDFFQRNVCDSELAEKKVFKHTSESFSSLVRSYSSDAQVKAPQSLSVMRRNSIKVYSSSSFCFSSFISYSE